MKKLFAILLIMLYGVSSTGATVQLHYCCGKLKSIKLGSAHVKDCGNSFMMGSKPCCETKEVTSKSQEQQDVITININSKAPVEAQTFFTNTVAARTTLLHVDQKAVYNSPPLVQSLCILNCVFRI